MKWYKKYSWVLILALVYGVASFNEIELDIVDFLILFLAAGAFHNTLILLEETKK